MSDSEDSRENLVMQARALSSGTLSYLCESTLYAVVDQVRAEFIEFCEENDQHYQSWVAAWRDYAKLKGYGKLAKVTR